MPEEDGAAGDQMLAFRVSRPYKELIGVFDRMKDACDKYIVYQHDADEEITRTHVHGLCVGIKVSTDTLKNWIKKELKTSAFPKTDWSFVTELQGKPVNEQFITYMAKGHLEPVRSTWDNDEVLRLRGEWSDEYRTRGMKRQYKIIHMVTPQEAKKTYNQMINEIHIRLEENYSDDNILRTLIRYVNEKQLIVGRYKIRDMFDTIKCRTKPDTYAQDLAQLCGFKYFDNT